MSAIVRGKEFQPPVTTINPGSSEKEKEVAKLGEKNINGLTSKPPLLVHRRLIPIAALTGDASTCKTLLENESIRIHLIGTDVLTRIEQAKAGILSQVIDTNRSLRPEHPIFLTEFKPLKCRSNEIVPIRLEKQDEISKEIEEIKKEIEITKQQLLVCGEIKQTIQPLLKSLEHHENLAKTMQKNPNLNKADQDKLEAELKLNQEIKMLSEHFKDTYEGKSSQLEKSLYHLEKMKAKALFKQAEIGMTEKEKATTALNHFYNTVLDSHPDVGSGFEGGLLQKELISMADDIEAFLLSEEGNKLSQENRQQLEKSAQKLIQAQKWSSDSEQPVEEIHDRIKQLGEGESLILHGGAANHAFLYKIERHEGEISIYNH